MEATTDTLEKILLDKPDVHMNRNCQGDPWANLYKAFEGDIYFEEWQDEIAAYRKRCDEESKSV